MASLAAIGRARAWLFDVFVHHHAENLRINREAQRKQMSLPGNDYPYPGAVTSSNNPTTVNNTGSGLIKGALLSAALLAGGAGGALGLGALLRPALVAPAAIAPTMSTTSATPGTAKPSLINVEIPWRVTKDGKFQTGTPKLTPTAP